MIDGFIKGVLHFWTSIDDVILAVVHSEFWPFFGEVVGVLTSGFLLLIMLLTGLVIVVELWNWMIMKVIGVKKFIKKRKRVKNV
jgi:hypothetical protein